MHARTSTAAISRRLGSEGLCPRPAAAAERLQEQLQQQTTIKSGEGYGNFSAQGTLMDVAQTELIAASASSMSNSICPLVRTGLR